MEAKIEPEIRKKVEARLEGKEIPNPETPEFTEFIKELYAIEPALAQELALSVQYEDFPDPGDEQRGSAARREQARGISRSLFMRKEPFSEEWVIDKRKVGMWSIAAIGLIMVPLLMAPNPNRGVASNTDNRPEIGYEISPPPAPLPPPTVSLPEDNKPEESVSIPPAPTLPEAPEMIPPSLPAPPPPPTPSVPDIAIPEIPQVAVSPQIPSGPVSTNPIIFKSANTPQGTRIYASQNQTQLPSRIYTQAQENNSETSGSASSNDPNNLSGLSASLNQAVLPGTQIEAELATGLLIYQGGESPVVATDSMGRMWIGNATLDDSRRVNVTFNQVDGMTTNAIALSDNSYPGLYANIDEKTPSLIADLFRGSVSAFSNYVQDRADDGEVIVVNDTVIGRDDTPDIEYYLADSVARLFSLPEGEQAMIRVAEVKPGTKFKILVLQ